MGRVIYIGMVALLVGTLITLVMSLGVDSDVDIINKILCNTEVSELFECGEEYE